MPTTALAQPAPDAPDAPAANAQPSAADLESARELFKEAREARQNGDLKLALDRFKAAHAYGQTPVTALELGRTHLELHELIEAREVLLSVARMKVQSDETDKSAAARNEAADLANEVKTRIPTVSVTITGVPADTDVTVTVDDVAIPVVSLTGIRKVNPGKHVVVTRAGTREERRELVLEEGKTAEITVDMAGAGPITSAGAPGSAPASPGAGKVISPVTWIGLGVTALGVGVGTVAGILALGKASDVDSACTGTHCPPSARDDVDAGRSAATISTVGFVVGGAGAITAAVGYFLLSKPKATTGRITPYVTVTSAGFNGTF